MDADRYAFTDCSVYSFSLSAFAFGRMRVNGEWSLLEVAPANTATLSVPARVIGPDDGRQASVHRCSRQNEEDRAHGTCSKYPEMIGS